MGADLAPVQATKFIVAEYPHRTAAKFFLGSIVSQESPAPKNNHLS
jgi:hypothetical protein